jgi:hypothetical protein
MTYDFDWLITNYVNFFLHFGRNESALRAQFAEWKASTGSDSVKEFLWQALLGLETELEQSDTDERRKLDLYRHLHYEMWAYQIRDGVNGTQYHKKLLENDLRMVAMDHQYKMEVEIISGHCCPHCDELHGEVISLEEALHANPLATSNCTRPLGCNCTYSPIAVRDADGQFVLA